MLKLQLFPSEFRVLIGYLRSTTKGQEYMPLATQSVSMLVLLNYMNAWKEHRIIAWLERNPKRAYALNLPLPVSVALYEDMQHAQLTGHEQLLLNKLDQAIVNYRNPHATPHVIGELVRQA